ncbi:DUF2937 family protein [Aliiglaciecola sp. CAU 1673]|uniref:DUF2937 family protein n=1 Tax=Aliiglaciecola sp. CAU 1673 TaxID=3032595 RepID=UPI0023DC20E6|nr:DUF2937 family protein [Aliiglaciecola sp. CAU 1673]MDF2178141.1 DUF2937 family protein [Aliiglaciecola sp. CAU 1673]
MRWMAAKLADYLRLGTFMLAVLIGVQLPGFIQQYEDALQARLAEVRHNLAPFLADAKRHSGGDLNALIARYLANSDEAISDGGKSLKQMVEREAYLADLTQQLASSAVTRAWYALAAPDQEIFKQVRAGYDYRVPLDISAILWGLSCGVLLLILLDMLLGLLAWPFKRPERQWR